MNFILIAVIVLGAIGLIAAVVLFAASKKFAVYEDPRIAQVSELLPGANCGGCGFPGCSGMADALVKGADAGSLEGLMCPVGGAETMGKVADLLGMAIANSEPMVAVVRCNGTCEHRARIAEYAGLRTCAAMHACGAGETACGFGCLGCGDCEAACQFGAIKVNPETGIPEVDRSFSNFFVVRCLAFGAALILYHFQTRLSSAFRKFSFKLLPKSFLFHSLPRSTALLLYHAFLTLSNRNFPYSAVYLLFKLLYSFLFPSA